MTEVTPEFVRQLLESDFPEVDLALGVAAAFACRARYWSEERTYWAEHAQRLAGNGSR